MQVSDWRPPEIDLDAPNAARMYDYALGGTHNFPADRAAAEELFRIYPDAPLVGRANRAFLRRAVRYCAGQGITQFLDLGSGIPTVGNVHEIAQRINPASRVVYVDNEPVAVAFTQHLLEEVPEAVAVNADVREVDAVLGARETRILDFDRPIALMMVAIMHYVSDADGIHDIVARYTAALAPGSLVVISHTTGDDQPEAEAIRKLLEQTPTPVTHRSRAEVTALFQGLDLVEPGVVWTPQWHPDDPTDPLHDNPVRSATYAGVGRVRAAVEV